MRVELTALYEPLPGGGVVAHVAEVPEVSAAGDSLEAARKLLAEKLRQFLRHARESAVRRARPQTHVEPISVELSEAAAHRAEPPTGAGLAAVRVQPYGEADLIRHLLERGLIPGPLPEIDPDADFEPVPIQGRPISEEIIEARR
jgi:predicted RNase H-like HicB family nuclease